MSAQIASASAKIGTAAAGTDTDWPSGEKISEALVQKSPGMSGSGWMCDCNRYPSA